MPYVERRNDLEWRFVDVGFHGEHSQCSKGAFGEFNIPGFLGEDARRGGFVGKEFQVVFRLLDMLVRY